MKLTTIICLDHAACYPSHVKRGKQERWTTSVLQLHQSFFTVNFFLSWGVIKMRKSQSFSHPLSFFSFCYAYRFHLIKEHTERAFSIVLFFDIIRKQRESIRKTKTLNREKKFQGELKRQSFNEKAKKKLLPYPYLAHSLISCFCSMSQLVAW